MRKPKISTAVPKYGDIIKAYDFPGSLECYMVGKVVNTDDDYIYCTMIKQVFGDQTVADPDESFRTPKQGYSFGDDSFQRIVVIA
jgi:hypothetical protein